MINTKIRVFIIMESSKLEKTIEKMVESHFKNIKTPEDFHGIKVDVYPTKYGKVAHIAILMKKPFSEKDSDFLYDIGKDAKNFVKTMFGDYLKGGISCGNSTIDSYNNTKWWYEEKKKLDENVKSVFVVTESQYNVIKEEVEKPVLLTSPNNFTDTYSHVRGISSNLNQFEKKYYIVEGQHEEDRLRCALDRLNKILT